MEDHGEIWTQQQINSDQRRQATLHSRPGTLQYDVFRYADGIHVRYRTDGRLFNPRRLKAVTKVKDTAISDLLFADDCAFKANAEQKMQQEINCFSACDNFVLTISKK